MKCAVYGILSVNNINNEEGQKLTQIGGEAFYAYNGLKSCECSTKVISGIGRDFRKFGEEWVRKNHICREGLLTRTDYCVHNLIDSEGEFHSVYGEEFSKYNEMLQRIFVSHLTPYIKDIDLLYFSDMLDYTSAQKIIEMKKQFGFQIIWQIPKVNITRERNLVLQNVKCADVLSICADNAFCLFDCNDENIVINFLAEWDRPVYYLSSTGDSCMIAQNVIYRIASEGNHRRMRTADRIAFEATAAPVVLWALISGFNYAEALCLASAIAQLNVLSWDGASMKAECSLEDIHRKAKSLMQKIVTSVVL